VPGPVGPAVPGTATSRPDAEAGIVTGVGFGVGVGRLLVGAVAVAVVVVAGAGAGVGDAAVVAAAGSARSPLCPTAGRRISASAATASTATPTDHRPG
jgi:hypothetical protein